MKREPTFLYFFRILLWIALIALLALLYWSSDLIEEQVIGVRKEVGELQDETERVHEDLQRHERQETESKEKKKKKQTGSNLPNMLKKDPFYAVTLPKLLGPHFRPKYTFHEDTVGKPSNLHPFSNWSNVNSWTSQCSLTLSRLLFGKYETMSPYMAVRMEQKPRKDGKGIEFWIRLRDHVYWQPLEEGIVPSEIKLAEHFKKRHQVTAHDFKFYYDAVMNPSVEAAGAVSLRNYLADIDEVEVVDDLTLIVRWKVDKYSAKLLTGSLQPLAIFVYQYFSDGSKIIENDKNPDTYRTNSVWAQNFDNHWAKNIIVSCGPWIFDGMNEFRIKFRRNPNHFFPLDALEAEQMVTFKNGPDNIWQDFQAGKVDTYVLQPNQVVELKDFLNSNIYHKQKFGISRLDYLARTYHYIGWNMAKPYFKSEKVRQALTMAIDRKRIISEILNGLGVEITGPFFRDSPSYDTAIAPWPFDPDQSRHLLEEEGWYDSNADGIRDKKIDGKTIPFDFTLTYYVKDPTTKAICEYIAMTLKEIGIRCHLNGVDIADLSSAFDDKSFDALCLAWSLGTPPEDPSQLWLSKWAKVKGSSNAVGFSNHEADRIIEKLEFEKNHEKRIALYHRFHAILHEEQPYTFLFTPKSIFLYRDYVKNVFIPSKRQDLVPGADIAQPISSVFWLKK